MLDAVRAAADRDPALHKLFVCGLGWETNSDSLRTIFSTYGDLEEAVVITDKSTGRSKGYGFVTFRHTDSASLPSGLSSLVVRLQARLGLHGIAAARLQLLVQIGKMLGCIAVGCPDLRELSLKWSLGDTDLGVELVALKCKKLRILDPSYTTITKDEFRKWTLIACLVK